MEGFIGQIILFAGNFAPRTWAFCEGQLLLIAQNSALFSILGTTYGGDGENTFALPDLRGRAAIAPGNGPGLTSYRLGEKTGSETINLTTANVPSHAHTTSVKAASEGDTDNPSGSVVAGNGANSFSSVADTNLSSEDSGNTGGNQPVNNVQPVLAVHYIICLQGAFPSRS